MLAANTSWNLINFRSNIILALLRCGYRVIAFAPRDAHSAKLEALGVEFVEVPFRSAAMSPARDFALFLRYLALLRRFEPSAFLGFTIKPNIYGSFAAQMLRIPVINNVSGLGTAFIKTGLVTKIATHLYRQAFRLSSTVFFQNDEDRQQFIAAKIVDATRAELIPGSGIDLDHFVPVALPTGSPFTFLLPARLIGDKGVREYVEAAAIVRRRHPDTRFQIIGPTDVDNRTLVPRATLDKWIGIGLIEHLGVTDDIRVFIAAADCVVLPSYREGLPRSLLEASAMARPIVATDVPGTREVIDDHMTGLLCRVRSGESLAERMLEMIALPLDARRAMGLAGRAKVEREFAIGRVTDHYVSAVQRALRSAALSKISFDSGWR